MFIKITVENINATIPEVSNPVGCPVKNEVAGGEQEKSL
jgi:hypothetical protein